MFDALTFRGIDMLLDHISVRRLKKYEFFAYFFKNYIIELRTIFIFPKKIVFIFFVKCF